MQEIDINEEFLDEEDAEESSDSYSQLVWQRFSRSKAAIVGGLMVVVLIILAIFPSSSRLTTFTRQRWGILIRRRRKFASLIWTATFLYGPLFTNRNL